MDSQIRHAHHQAGARAASASAEVHALHRADGWGGLAHPTRWVGRGRRRDHDSRAALPQKALRRCESSAMPASGPWLPRDLSPGDAHGYRATRHPWTGVLAALEKTGGTLVITYRMPTRPGRLIGAPRGVRRHAPPGRFCCRLSRNLSAIASISRAAPARRHDDRQTPQVGLASEAPNPSGSTWAEHRARRRGRTARGQRDRRRARARRRSLRGSARARRSRQPRVQGPGARGGNLSTATGAALRPRRRGLCGRWPAPDAAPGLGASPTAGRHLMADARRAASWAWARACALSLETMTRSGKQIVLVVDADRPAPCRRVVTGRRHPPAPCSVAPRSTPRWTRSSNRAPLAGPAGACPRPEALRSCGRGPCATCRCSTPSGAWRIMLRLQDLARAAAAQSPRHRHHGRAARRRLQPADRAHAQALLVTSAAASRWSSS